MGDSKSSNNTTKKKEEEEEEEEEEVLKKKISNHPLYGLMVDTHLQCLKVSSIADKDQKQEMNPKLPSRRKPPSTSNSLCQSELDCFMEAYCSTLRELKEALEQPQEEAIAFVNSMRAQLKELTVSDAPEPDDHHEASASSSVD